MQLNEFTSGKFNSTLTRSDSAKMNPDVPKPPKWDPWMTFSASPEQIELALQRKAIAEQKKLDFKRMIENPKNHSGTGGYVFDPALQKWYSARMTYARTYTHGRNSPAAMFFFYIIPVLVGFKLSRWERTTRWAAIESGETKTSEKQFKLHFIG